MRFNEGIQIEYIQNCLLCGTKGVLLYEEMRDRLFDVPGVWSLLRCPQDGLVWMSPRPVVEDLAKVYTTYFTHNLAKGRQSFLASLKYRVERAVLNTEFGYENLPIRQGSGLIGRIFGLLPMAKEIGGSSVMWLTAHPDGKLLDVGCGNGDFLAVMQKLRWNVFGIEPDSKAAMIARERLGAPVTIGTLEDADFLDDTFDAVTAHHVIEHMHDPIGFLREAWRILKPDGKLVVATPNIESLGHRIFRKSWRGLEPPRHLHIFSTSTLGMCAKQMGYRVEKLRTSARSAWEIWYSSRLIHRDGSIPGGFPKFLSPRLLFEGLVFQLFQYMLIPFKCLTGEGIVMIVSKSRRQ